MQKWLSLTRSRIRKFIRDALSRYREVQGRNLFVDRIPDGLRPCVSIATSLQRNSERLALETLFICIFFSRTNRSRESACWLLLLTSLSDGNPFSGWQSIRDVFSISRHARLSIRLFPASSIYSWMSPRETRRFEMTRDFSTLTSDPVGSPRPLPSVRANLLVSVSRCNFPCRSNRPPIITKIFPIYSRHDVL